MDLNELDTCAGADVGFDFDLRHPGSGLPFGPTIRLLGRDSVAYRDKSIELAKLRTDILARNPRFIPTQSQMDADAIELYVSVTRGWKDLPKLDGEELAFSEANARKLYTRFPWIREQVDRAIHDRANFLPGSGTSS